MADKTAARQVIDSLALPEAQRRTATRAISRATRSESIDIQTTAQGEVVIRRTRPGAVGRQVFECTIRPDGSSTVVQMAYDDDGNLVHYDPKGGGP